jgi:copper chaperone CopZ
MIKRALLLFAATSTLGVALACGGKPCGSCDGAAKAAAATDLTQVDGTAVKLAVSGVHCGGTAKAFHAAVMNIDGVTGATVDATGKAEVKFDAAKLDVDKLIAAVAETGTFTAKKADEA